MPVSVISTNGYGGGTVQFGYGNDPYYASFDGTQINTSAVIRTADGSERLIGFSLNVRTGRAWVTQTDKGPTGWSDEKKVVFAGEFANDSGGTDRPAPADAADGDGAGQPGQERAG